jgi:hypothetical protein
LQNFDGSLRPEKYMLTQVNFGKATLPKQANHLIVTKPLSRVRHL